MGKVGVDRSLPKCIAPCKSVPVMFVARGAHDVGGGVPDNALQYNSGLALDLPGGALFAEDPIADFHGMAPSTRGPV
jgi:hypothetical protein